MRTNINAILTIAFRDITKYLRDRTRIIIGLIFPLLFIGALGGSIESSWGAEIPYNFMMYVFTGVFAQTMFQSAASGIISLIEDRENDFAQELFVAPVARTAIIIGKILGESVVALLQGLSIFVFILIFQIPATVQQLLIMIPFALIAALLGAAFGLVVLANLSNQRTANQLFPLLIFPQFFLAGVFNPVQNLPPVLEVLSRISPMTYAVDLIRSFFYAGTPEADYVVIFGPQTNLLVIGVMFLVFITFGTWLFVRNEKNR